MKGTAEANRLKASGVASKECVLRVSRAAAAKHGVSFDEAVTVFLDGDVLDGTDLQYSNNEVRFLQLGRSAVGAS